MEFLSELTKRTVEKHPCFEKICVIFLVLSLRMNLFLLNLEKNYSLREEQIFLLLGRKFILFVYQKVLKV